MYILYPGEILGLECIPRVDISLHHDLNFNFDTDPIVLRQKFSAAPMPVEQTEVMSIYFDDIETIYRRVREKENQHQLNTITKIKWFALLEPYRA